MLLASVSSCSRSKVLVPVSAWSSPAESVSRSRCSSLISERCCSYSARSSSRRPDRAARIFSVSAAERVGRSGAAFLAAAVFASVGFAIVAPLAPVVAATPDAFSADAFSALDVPAAGGTAVLRAGVALAVVATFVAAVFAAGAVFAVFADLAGWAARELADLAGWAALAEVAVSLTGVGLGAFAAAVLRGAFSAVVALLAALAGVLFAFLVGSALVGSALIGSALIGSALVGSAAFATFAVVLVAAAFAVADLAAGADFFEAAAVFLAGAVLVVALVAGAFFDGVAEPARPFEDADFPGAAACAAVFFTATPFLAVAAGAASAAFFVGALAGDRLTTRESVLSNCVATCAGMVLLLALRRPSARSAIALPHMQNRRAAGRRAL